ncbi:HNH endonuclease [Azospira oryzae]|uniref:HNH endonuclease n=1 Tax=Azospira oryzae TaxID=146939 RepID=UPI001962F2E0|nr:HNH endonuclease [Azospira oryzae]
MCSDADESFNCLYCGEDKPSSQASLEHAIPQFMGGNSAPRHYFLRNVCEGCNNKLGLFVDASYAKSWFFTNHLATASRRLYSGLQDQPLPLCCIGLLKAENFTSPDGCVAETWLGPSGETIIWIRKYDERVYWYSGGNPSDKRRTNSTAYFFPTSNDPTRFRMGIASFQTIFKAKKIRKILCAQIEGLPANSAFPGFDLPTEDERHTVDVLRRLLASGKVAGHYALNINFDLRFISKIALAVGYSLFGEQYLATQAAKELRKGVWPAEGETPEIMGAPSLSHPSDPLFTQFAGYPGAVALTVIRTGQSYGLTITIDQRLPFAVELAPATLESKLIDPHAGYMLLLFPQLGKAIELSMADRIIHENGSRPHPELEEIDAKLLASRAFFAQLPPI